MENVRFVGIDPSSSTGFVILDLDGNVILEQEIKIKHRLDPLRMIEICNQIKKELNPKTDKVTIEGFSYGSKGKGVSFQYGLGWLIRAMLFIENVDYREVTPSQVKKFASNKGNAKKEDLIEPVKKKWNFVGLTDNTTDAYILARVAKGLYDGLDLLPYEKAVLKNIEKFN